ncbi:hypothetical protein Cadr_000002701 [Camelus dromedarius]|uniref:Uncharacterized protein n=1 Tax=Camelus dromedarius TaxID=9838 RepID=A0A5N4C412_CAMDR|nr:hypothetical protein Cadr_000002701 [Camelus dromedarius]
MSKTVAWSLILFLGPAGAAVTDTSKVAWMGLWEIDFQAVDTQRLRYVFPRMATWIGRVVGNGGLPEHAHSCRVDIYLGGILETQDTMKVMQRSVLLQMFTLPCFWPCLCLQTWLGPHILFDPQKPDPISEVTYWSRTRWCWFNSPLTTASHLKLLKDLLGKHTSLIQLTPGFSFLSATFCSDQPLDTLRGGGCGSTRTGGTLGHTSPSVLTSIDESLYSGAFILSLSRSCGCGLGLSLVLGLWPTEPETLGDAGTSTFPELGVSNADKSAELAAAALWDLRLDLLGLSESLDSFSTCTHGLGVVGLHLLQALLVLLGKVHVPQELGACLVLRRVLHQRFRAWGEDRGQQHCKELLVEIEGKGLGCESYEKHRRSNKRLVPLPHPCTGTRVSVHVAECATRRHGLVAKRRLSCWGAAPDFLASLRLLDFAAREVLVLAGESGSGKVGLRPPTLGPSTRHLLTLMLNVVNDPTVSCCTELCSSERLMRVSCCCWCVLILWPDSSPVDTPSCPGHTPATAAWGAWDVLGPGEEVGRGRLSGLGADPKELNRTSPRLQGNFHLHVCGCGWSVSVFAVCPLPLRHSARGASGSLTREWVVLVTERSQCQLQQESRRASLTSRCGGSPQAGGPLGWVARSEFLTPAAQQLHEIQERPSPLTQRARLRSPKTQGIWVLMQTGPGVHGVVCSLLPGSRLRTSGLMFCRSVPATPPTPHPEQDQRHVLVLLTWWPKGSLRKGRCQISYSLSYLSKGRTSALAWRPRPLPPTPCHQCPRPQSSEPRPGTRFQAHTETHLHPSRSQTRHQGTDIDKRISKPEGEHSLLLDSGSPTCGEVADAKGTWCVTVGCGAQTQSRRRNQVNREQLEQLKPETLLHPPENQRERWPSKPLQEKIKEDGTLRGCAGDSVSGGFQQRLFLLRAPSDSVITQHKAFPWRRGPRWAVLSSPSQPGTPRGDRRHIPDSTNTHHNFHTKAPCPPHGRSHTRRASSDPWGPLTCRPQISLIERHQKPETGKSQHPSLLKRSVTHNARILNAAEHCLFLDSADKVPLREGQLPQQGDQNGRGARPPSSNASQHINQGRDSHGLGGARTPDPGGPWTSRLIRTCPRGSQRPGFMHCPLTGPSPGACLPTHVQNSEHGQAPTVSTHMQVEILRIPNWPLPCSLGLVLFSSFGSAPRPDNRPRPTSSPGPNTSHAPHAAVAGVCPGQDFNKASEPREVSEHTSNSSSLSLASLRSTAQYNMRRWAVSSPTWDHSPRSTSASAGASQETPSEDHARPQRTSTRTSLAAKSKSLRDARKSGAAPQHESLLFATRPCLLVAHSATCTDTLVPVLDAEGAQDAYLNADASHNFHTPAPCPRSLRAALCSAAVPGPLPTCRLQASEGRTYPLGIPSFLIRTLRPLPHLKTQQYITIPTRAETLMEHTPQDKAGLGMRSRAKN